MKTKTADRYLVVAFVEGRGELGVNRDLSLVAPDEAELLTPDEARCLVDRLRAAGRPGHAITETRFFGDDAEDSFDF